MNDTNTSEMLRGFVDVIVISLLKEGGDYVYNLVKKIRERSDGFFSVTNPALLLTMKKLYSAGFVTYENELNERGVNRKRYTLTEKGKEYGEKQMPICEEALKKIGRLLEGEKQ